MAQPVIIRGGGRLQYKGEVYFAKEDIIINFESSYKTDQNLIFNETPAAESAGATVKFKPIGQMQDDNINPLFAMLLLQPGDNLFDGTNYPLTINTKNGILWTFPNAVVSGMPGLNFKSTESILGEVTFTCRHADFSWTTADSLYTRTSVAYPSTTEADSVYYDPTEVFKSCAKIGWAQGGDFGANTWPAAVYTKDGATVDWQISLTDDETDCDGKTGIIFQDLAATIKAKPLLGTADQLIPINMSLQGSAAGRGTAPLAEAMVIGNKDDDAQIVINGAFITRADISLSRTNPRIGEVEWQARGTDGAYPIAYWSALVDL